ncbi:ABC transporter substrate-binding protein [Microbacterium ureisolvens]|uniref:ABC transporter substrate-binding protein n=1 Tax=Microbacterium ureisolvens TaxID=2781186 RepID=UPI00363F6801
MFTHRKRAVAGAVAGAAAIGLALTGCAGGSPAAETTPTYDPDEKVTLDFAFWGNDVRAELYNEVLEAFHEEHPNITVNTSFLGFPEYWEKRQTEAAGGGLPDVMQTDINYLRQYAENGLFLDLTPYLGSLIDTEPLPENVLQIGQLDGVTTGITISTNAWSMYQNSVLLDEIGVEPFEEGDWQDYNDWMADVTEAAEAKGLEVWGGADYTGRIQSFEIQQRAKGEDLFTEDGEVNFTEDELRAYWESGQELRDGIATPQQRLEEVLPMSGFDTALQTSEMTWDSFGVSYLANLGEPYTELQITAPPVTEEGAKDLYKKAGMLLSASADTEHPEAAAILIDYLVNDPVTGEVFGTNRGFPASETAMSGATLDGINQQIADYEESIADRLGDAPPVPVTGYGTIEDKFRQIGIELNFGTITVDEAVDQFFAEMDVVLSQ